MVKTTGTPAAHKLNSVVEAAVVSGGKRSHLLKPQPAQGITNPLLPVPPLNCSHFTLKLQQLKNWLTTVSEIIILHVFSHQTWQDIIISE